MEMLAVKLIFAVLVLGCVCGLGIADIRLGRIKIGIKRLVLVATMHSNLFATI